MPLAQFSERHALDGIAASPADVLDAVLRYDDRQDPVLNLLLKVREAPARVAARWGLRNGLDGRGRFGLADFTLLARSDDSLTLGLVGRFWRPDFGLEPLADADDFGRIRPGVARLLLRYWVQPGTAAGRLRLFTETRVHCPDRRTFWLFAPYWYAIRLPSGLIRRRILGQVRRVAEAHRTASPLS